MSNQSMFSAPTAKKVTVLLIGVALVSGLIFGLIGAYIFAKPGPQGLQGEQGIQGDPGLDGSDSIIQIIQSQNVTATSLVAYTPDQWHNLSVIDSSMRLTITVQDGSRLCARFLSSVALSSSGSLSLKVVVDNQLNSIVYNAGIQPAVTLTLPIQVEILTDALSAGDHTIEVQFLRNTGSQVLMGRSLSVTEMT